MAFRMACRPRLQLHPGIGVIVHIGQVGGPTTVPVGLDALAVRNRYHDRPSCHGWWHRLALKIRKESRRRVSDRAGGFRRRGDNRPQRPHDDRR